MSNYFKSELVGQLKDGLSHLEHIQFFLEGLRINNEIVFQKLDKELSEAIECIKYTREELLK